MIYLDNAATTGQKPESVVSAFSDTLKFMSVNPGRGCYDRSAQAAALMYECRASVKELINADSESSVCFTMNCTHAINSVIYGTVKKGDHIVVSSLEHNAVIRPIADLFLKKTATYSIAKVVDDDEITVRNFADAIKPNTRLVITTAASNVTGKLLPIKSIGALCKNRGISFAVDAAQAAGVIELDMAQMNIDYLCIAPHKGFYAPMGVGILVANKPVSDVIIKGGTGYNSKELVQPDALPERIESGTVNLPAIVATNAGIRFVRQKGMTNIYRHEIELCRRLFDALSDLGCELYGEPPNINKSCPVLSFNVMGKDSDEIGRLLSQNGIAVRCGLHCAPLAHKQLGTLDRGTVRVSPSVFNNRNDIDRLIFILKKQI